MASVTASDGRKVLIQYKPVDNDTTSFSYLDSSFYRQRVARVYTPENIENNIDITYKKISNGYEVDHGLGKKYRYTFNYVKSDKNVLARVDYPAGGRVSYSYPQYAQPIISSKNINNANKHLPLVTRTTSGPNIVSGTWDFDSTDALSDNRFARLIHTPSNTLEYRYRKTGWEEDYLDSGMLLEKKISSIGKLTGMSF